MIKIPTLYKKNPENLGLVINEINPDCQWVFDGEGIATRKFDGTAAAIINGEIYKRYDVKKGRSVPEGAIPCQEPDAITGHWPHWVKCDRNNKEDRYFFEGLDNMLKKAIILSEFNPKVFDGTYELCGPKINGNKEGLTEHSIIVHGCEVLNIIDFSFLSLKIYLTDKNIEGIVFHHKTDGRMCKIRKTDFGIKR